MMATLQLDKFHSNRPQPTKLDVATLSTLGAFHQNLIDTLDMKADLAQPVLHPTEEFEEITHTTIARANSLMEMALQLKQQETSPTLWASLMFLARQILLVAVRALTDKPVLPYNELNDVMSNEAVRHIFKPTHYHALTHCNNYLLLLGTGTSASGAPQCRQTDRRAAGCVEGGIRQPVVHL